MDPSAARPWDQRPDEPPDAYARFLSYRNLGPGRTLPLAESCHGGATGRTKKHASGHWTEACVRHEWVSRAAAWDIDQLKSRGPELARLWTGILVAAARKAAQKLADPACVPKDFAAAVAVIDRLAPYITPDVLAALQPPAGDPGGRPAPPADPRALVR
jgi:hypothetical protein